jgi:hypothetical protein
VTRLIYCLPAVFNEPPARDNPGMTRFLSAVTLYGGKWAFPIDRTGTIRTPVRSVSLFPIPQSRAFTKSYEEICNDRAREILRKADELGIRIYVLYSGGIDSTCLLVSLLKEATPEQKKGIVVLMSHESIAENPRFYEEHIRGKLRVESSIMFINLLGGDDIILSAELNDQIMGSDIIGKMIVRYGTSVIHEPYDRDKVLAIFGDALSGDVQTARFYVDLFERIRDAAPVPIRSNFEFLWWINFTTKWQACLAYVLLFMPTRKARAVRKDYLDTRFLAFFNTDEFQLWALNNPDKRIKDSWASYKWIAKDVIYDYTKDAEYRDNKTKVQSRALILRQHYLPNKFVDENMEFSNELAPESYLEPKNDFATWHG